MEIGEAVGSGVAVAVGDGVISGNGVVVAVGDGDSIGSVVLVGLGVGSANGVCWALSGELATNLSSSD